MWHSSSKRPLMRRAVAHTCARMRACLLSCLFPCFLASLLPCLLPCFLASLLPCFRASLLASLLPCLLPCFLASLLACKHAHARAHAGWSCPPSRSTAPPHAPLPPTQLCAAWRRCVQLPRLRHIGELKLYYDQIAKDAERVPASLLMSVWVRSWMPEDSPSFSCVLYVQLHLSDSSADADEESDKLEAAVLLLEEMVFLLFFCG